MARQPKFDVETRLQIVLEHLSGNSASEICRRYGISQSHLYRLKDRFLEGARNGVAGKIADGRNNEDRARIADLERTLGKLALENQILKKTLN